MKFSFAINVYFCEYTHPVVLPFPVLDERSSRMADRVGQQLGNYRLLRLLGQGSFAAVYLGEHLYLERPAAIKVLHVQMEPATFESFRREARTIAQLHHPHIV